MSRHGDWPVHLTPSRLGEADDSLDTFLGLTMPIIKGDCPNRCCEGCGCEPGTCLCDGVCSCSPYDVEE